MPLKFRPKTARIHTDEGCPVQRWQQLELWAESAVGANIRNMVNVRGRPRLTVWPRCGFSYSSSANEAD